MQLTVESFIQLAIARANSPSGKHMGSVSSNTWIYFHPVLPGYLVTAELFREACVFVIAWALTFPLNPPLPLQPTVEMKM